MTSEFLQRVSGFTTGLAIKAPCVVETTANITLSGEQTINSVAVVAEDRVLVKDQTAGAENGIWVVKATAWVRADDFNGSRDVTRGTLVQVINSSIYELTTTGTITIGTTSLAFSAYSISTTASIDAISPLTPAADKGVYFTSSTAAALFTLTAFARTLVDDSSASAARTTLGLATVSQAEAEAGTATTTRAWTAERVKQAIDAFEVPAGSITMWMTATPPDGWLECDGAAVSRTVTYGDLFAAISTAYGVGDGSTTFNLPDMRGRFPRGWDHGAGLDPDAASRTDRGDGTTGDNIGTLQADELDSHLHALNLSNSGFAASTTVASVPGTRMEMRTSAQYNSGSTGGNETRPANINVMFIIKY